MPLWGTANQQTESQRGWRACLTTNGTSRNDISATLCTKHPFYSFSFLYLLLSFLKIPPLFIPPHLHLRRTRSCYKYCMIPLRERKKKLPQEQPQGLEPAWSQTKQKDSAPCLQDKKIRQRETNDRRKCCLWQYCKHSMFITDETQKLRGQGIKTDLILQ